MLPRKYFIFFYLHLKIYLTLDPTIDVFLKIFRNSQNGHLTLHLWTAASEYKYLSLREKCPHSEFFWSVFGMNTESYVVSLCIQSECGKIQTRKINKDTFYTVYINLHRLTQPRKSLNCMLATHKFVNLQLASLLACNSQLAVSQIRNLLAGNMIDQQLVDSHLATRWFITLNLLACTPTIIELKLLRHLAKRWQLKEVFYRNNVLKSFAKFMQKHLYRSFFLINC